MNDATGLPSMFYLEPRINTSKLRIGAEFECVFCPESTTHDGWVIIRFRVVMHERHYDKQWMRGVQPLSKTAITESEVFDLYREIYEGVLT